MIRVDQNGSEWRRGSLRREEKRSEGKRRETKGREDKRNKLLREDMHDLTALKREVVSRLRALGKWKANEKTERKLEQIAGDSVAMITTTAASWRLGLRAPRQAAT